MKALKVKIFNVISITHYHTISLLINFSFTFTNCSLQSNFLFVVPISGTFSFLWWHVSWCWVFVSWLLSIMQRVLPLNLHDIIFSWNRSIKSHCNTIQYDTICCISFLNLLEPWKAMRSASARYSQTQTGHSIFPPQMKLDDVTGQRSDVRIRNLATVLAAEELTGKFWRSVELQFRSL